MSERDDEGTGTGELPGLSRRAFLGWGGAGTATAYIALSFGPGGKVLAKVINPPPPVDKPKKTYTTVLRRADDQLVLTLDFWNLVPDFTTSPPVLRQVDTSASANYLVVGFPGQNIIEEVFFRAGSPTNPQPDPGHNTSGIPTSPIAPPVQQRLAAASRLVFVIPSGSVAPTSSDPLPFSLDTVLDWMFYDLNVVPNAQPDIPASESALAIGHPTKPSATQTAIELPFRLQLSPYATSSDGSFKEGFVNAVDAVEHGGRTELWHTRLSVKKPAVFFYEFDETDRKHRTVRAVWATDPTFKKDMTKSGPASTDDLSFRGSLEYQDRYDIVRLSSDFSLTFRGLLETPQIFVPTPATVDRLMLSSLGGWIDADAHWDLPQAAKGYNSSLLQWRHRAAMGRDNYVRVVRKGFLFPYGHRASVVTISEREFSHISDKSTNATGAYLRQRVFIIVTEPEKDYFTADEQDPFVPHQNRKFPFTSLEAVTLVTPDLAPEEAYVSAYTGNPEKAFQPELSPGDPFLFHFRGTDWAGAPIDLRTPVVWVDSTEAFGTSDTNPGHIDEIISQWRTDQPSIDLKSQRVNMATPTDPDVPGDTQIVAESFIVGAEQPDPGATYLDLILADQPRFYPTLHTVTLKMPEAATASGHAITPPTLEYEPGTYLPSGFFSPSTPAGTKGGVFLSVPSSATHSAVTFSSDKAGGSVTPNLNVDAVSRHLGPASGDVGDLSAGNFDPAKVFGDVDARMLGGIKLQDILKQVQFGDASDNSDDPNAQALSLTSVELQHPHRVVTTFDWHPVIQTSSSDIPGVGAIFEVIDGDLGDSSDDSFDLHGVIVTNLDDPTKSTSTIVGQIRSFAINLFGNDQTYFMQIPFNSLTFRAEKGKKTDVDVDVGDVAFEGALSFVQDLASYLSFDGSGLTITTEGSAIQVELTLAIPSIGVGVFSLENLALSVGCAIPYDGSPVRFTFDFCSRENPFHLMVMMFGGGGFVGLQIGIDGVELLEFSFEFGAGISIDIGIASGDIELMGGFYFSVTTEHRPQGDIEELDFTAYVKASGGISALGIVSISVELYLGLTYEGPDPQLLAGDASMTVSVHVLFFGGSITISVHKEFENSTPAVSPQARLGHHALAGPFDDSVDNSFGGVMTADDWVQYCQSIAEVGV
jgi:hypothetical protein